MTPLCEEVTEQLRKRRLKASVVRIFIKYSDFSSFVRQRKIAPTNSTLTVFNEAMALFDGNADTFFSIRSVGVGVEEFSETATEQQDIFHIRTAVDDAIDRLRERYGDRIIKRGSVMKNSYITDFDKKHVAFNSNI